MVKLCWLIAHEKLESDPAEPKLSEAVVNNGYHLIKAYYDNLKSPFKYTYESVDDYDIVIAHGPIQFIKQLQKQIPNKLYIFGFKKDTDISYYTSYLNKDIPFFNSDYVILPYSKIYTYVTKKFFQLRDDVSYFIRPNSGFKSFNGFIVTCLGTERTLNEYKTLQKIDDHELCIITSSKNIKAEFRFVICNKKVIASSQYVWYDRKDVRIDVLPSALQLAEKVAEDNWQLDLVYVVDICIDNLNNAYVLEFNSFSSAGLYNCDRNEIVKNITNVALVEYESDL